MEVSEVVDTPITFDAILSENSLAETRFQSVGAEDDHVKSSRRCVVYPFCCKEADGMKGREIDLFSVY